MSKPTLAAGSYNLIRPAAIELRFSNKTQYKKHVRFYLKALGITKPFNPPKDPKPYTSADSSFAFRVGMVPKGWKDQDLQLRFVLLNRKQIGKNRTVIYWQVEKNNFSAISDSLKEKLGYEVIDPLHSTTIPASADSTRAILRLADTQADTSSTLVSSTALVAKNEVGNSVGLVINPPYPRYADTNKNTPGEGEGFLSTHPVFVGLLGLVVGLVLGWVFTRSRRRQTT